MPSQRILLQDCIQAISACVAQVSGMLDKECPPYAKLTIRTITVRITAAARPRRRWLRKTGEMWLDFSPNAAAKGKLMEGELVFGGNGDVAEKAAPSSDTKEKQNG